MARIATQTDSRELPHTRVPQSLSDGTPDTSKRSPTHAPVDASADAFQFILSLQSSTTAEAPDILYERAKRQLEQVKQRLSEISADEREAVILALAAFIDEVAIGSQSLTKVRWPSLQFQQLGTRQAGRQFFQKLHEIRGAEPNAATWRDGVKADLLELYYLCLLLGFKGQYGCMSKEAFARELNTMHDHIQRQRPSPLFPTETEGKQTERGWLRKDWRWWLWRIIAFGYLAGLVALTLFLLYKQGS
ncbi:DotU family type IV/VI secretion system protein [bacterium]|nr:DotU family type IV/VI secretion system protein [bacterium]